MWATSPAAARARRVAKVDTPIEHLVIACQENRSFDHYFGHFPGADGLPRGAPVETSAADWDRDWSKYLATVWSRCDREMGLDR